MSLPQRAIEHLVLVTARAARFCNCSGTEKKPKRCSTQLKGVLSVHELRAVRAWTAGEKAVPAKAAGS
jgi:hypothetical protein